MRSLNALLFPLKPILLLGLLLVPFTQLKAQQPVRGNGKMVEQTRPLKLFTSLRVDFPAKVVVDCGSMPGITIRTDANCMPHVVTQQRGKQLEVLQGRWIEPSKPVEVVLGTAFLSQLESSGYSSITINGLETPLLALKVDVGTVRLEGEVDQLQVETESGQIDASECPAKSIRLKAKEDAIFQVQAASGARIEANMPDPDSKLVLTGNAEVAFQAGSSRQLYAAADYRPEDMQAPVYIDFTLEYPGNRKADFYVKGPRNRTFSYGFPMQAGAKRAERWPVGTRVYQTDGIGRRLVLTVEADMAGQTVSMTNAR